MARAGTGAVMSGISRHSSEGNDALEGWGSAIYPLLTPVSVVKAVSQFDPKHKGRIIGDIAPAGMEIDPCCPARLLGDQIVKRPGPILRAIIPARGRASQRSAMWCSACQRW